MEVIGLGLIVYFGIIVWRFVIIPIYNYFNPPPTEDPPPPEPRNNNST